MTWLLWVWHKAAGVAPSSLRLRLHCGTLSPRPSVKCSPQRLHSETQLRFDDFQPFRKQKITIASTFFRSVGFSYRTLLSYSSRADRPPLYKSPVAWRNNASPFYLLAMPTAFSFRYNFFLFLLAQLIWAVPTYSRVTPSRGSLSNRLSNRSGPSESVAATWYSGLHSSDFTLQDLSWWKYSMVLWASA